MKNLKFVKGIVSSVVDKNEEVGFDLLLTPEDVENLQTGKGYLPISIRLGKDGKYYAYKATRRLAPVKDETIDEVYDLARISIEEAPYQDLDAVCEAVHINEVLETAKREYINKKNKI